MATAVFSPASPLRPDYGIHQTRRSRNCQQRLTGKVSPLSPRASSLKPGNAVQPTRSVRTFLRGRTLVLTGSTGFLAKIFLEKLLWEQPDVRKVFLIITPRSGRCAEARLRNEILDTPLFSRLRDKHGTGFESFIERRLYAVDGDIGLEGMGLSQENESAIIDEAEVFVNSAATTTFNERFDIAVNINTLGPRRILRLSRKCPNLMLMCHVSTAFVNGLRRGPVKERALRIGDCISQELDQNACGNELDPYAEVALALSAASPSFGTTAARGTRLPVAACVEENVIERTSRILDSFVGKIKIGSKQGDSSSNERSLSRVDPVFHNRMVRLGLYRARMHGWQDTYVFTKAMGEQLLVAERGDVPLVIFRPSIVEGALSEPFPGWIEGIRMADPLIIAYGKNIIRGFVGDPAGVLDLVPVDSVVNVMLAAMPVTARSKQCNGVPENLESMRVFGEEDINTEKSLRILDRDLTNPGLDESRSTCRPENVKVYHVATSTLNPLNFYDFMGIVSRHFVSSPLTDRRSGKTIITDKNIKVFTSRFAFEFDTWFRQGGMSVSFTWFLEKIKLKSVSPVTKRRNASMRRIFNELRSMGKIYLPYTTYKARFLSENVKALSTSLSEEDREAFPIELETLNWENYLRTAHIPGLLRHALKRYS